jgi:hypothetical protein
MERRLGVMAGSDLGRFERVAVITDIHGKLPRSRGVSRRSTGSTSTP